MKEFEFLNNGADIKIDRMDLPYPWVNYHTNTRLSAMISHAGGGFLWYLSPVKLRLTRYRYHQLPTDAPGFYIYIREEDGEVWCPTFMPMRDTDVQRSTVHRAGETVFYAERGQTRAKLSFAETDGIISFISSFFIFISQNLFFVVYPFASVIPSQ